MDPGIGPNTKAQKELYEHKKIKERKGNKTKRESHDIYCTLIKRLNSLIKVPSGVANCRNLPFGRRVRRSSRVHLPRKENARESPPMFIQGKR